MAFVPFQSTQTPFILGRKLGEVQDACEQAAFHYANQEACSRADFIEIGLCVFLVAALVALVVLWVRR